MESRQNEDNMRELKPHQQINTKAWHIDLKKISFIPLHAIPWIIWSIVGLYYFYEITLRVFPSTMRWDFMQGFQINATQFGVFTSIYYVSYVIMQIPAGLIVDRYSIRKTLFVACLLCMSGFFIIHASHTIGIAYIGRFVVGFGSAFAYVYTLKVATIWLPRRHFGLATCIADSLGMLGAIFADIVFVKINIDSSPHLSIVTLLVTGSIIAMLIFFVFRDKPGSKKTRELNREDTRDIAHIIDKIKRILCNPQIWLIGMVGCLFYLPASVIGDVWGLPYLQTVYHLSKKEAGYVLSSFFLGWVLAGPFLGAWSDHIRLRCFPMKLTITMDAVLLCAIIFIPAIFHVLLPTALLFIFFFLIGVSTGTHPLVFAMAKENFPDRIAGTVVAVINTLTMLGGLIFQPLVGYFLDLSHGTLHMVGAIKDYTSENYTFALSIIPISLVLCLIVMHFIKETGDQIKEDLPEETA
jgi:MFS family permease